MINLSYCTVSSSPVSRFFEATFTLVTLVPVLYSIPGMHKRDHDMKTTCVVLWCYRDLISTFLFIPLGSLPFQTHTDTCMESWESCRILWEQITFAEGRSFVGDVLQKRQASLADSMNANAHRFISYDAKLTGREAILYKSLCCITRGVASTEQDVRKGGHRSSGCRKQTREKPGRHR